MQSLLSTHSLSTEAHHCLARYERRCIEPGWSLSHSVCDCTTRCIGLWYAVNEGLQE